MSRLAPGRSNDMKMLLDRKEQAVKYTAKWNQICLKIEDLIEEGRCQTIQSLRGRLVNAARNGDTRELDKISDQINEHVKTKHRQRYVRGWIKKD